MVAIMAAKMVEKKVDMMEYKLDDKKAEW